jgi:hypothetical protein
MLTDEDAYIFDAMMDTPVSIQFELLYHGFPNAKFIYTTRPYELWVDAFTRHCQRHYHTVDFAVIRTFPAVRHYHPSITDFEKVDCALYFRYPRRSFGARGASKACDRILCRQARRKVAESANGFRQRAGTAL